MLVKEVDKKSVNEIAQFIKERGDKMRKNKGDIEHKKRTSIVNYVPAFMVGVILTIVNFITCKLGISIPFLALERDQFGCGCVTSLGTLGFEDAYAPFSGFMNYVFLASANSTVETAVVENEELKVGKVMMVNIGIDHRFVDGGRAKNFVRRFKAVFENPENFIS